MIDYEAQVKPLTVAEAVDLLRLAAVSSTWQGADPTLAKALLEVVEQSGHGWRESLTAMGRELETERASHLETRQALSRALADLGLKFVRSINYAHEVLTRQRDEALAEVERLAEGLERARVELREKDATIQRLLMEALKAKAPATAKCNCGSTDDLHESYCPRAP